MLLVYKARSFHAHYGENYVSSILIKMCPSRFFFSINIYLRFNHCGPSINRKLIIM